MTRVLEKVLGGGEPVDHMLRSEARAKKMVQKGRHATLAIIPCVPDQADRLERQTAGVWSTAVRPIDHIL